MVSSRLSKPGFDRITMRITSEINYKISHHQFSSINLRHRLYCKQKPDSTHRSPLQASCANSCVCSLRRGARLRPRMAAPLYLRLWFSDRLWFSILQVFGTWTWGCLVWYISLWWSLWRLFLCQSQFPWCQRLWFCDARSCSGVPSGSERMKMVSNLYYLCTFFFSLNYGFFCNKES